MTTILKCKMCGGNIEIQEGSTVAKCRYCGSMMTLPRIDNDKKARLFNRANEYRLNNEFDKAYDAYKAITEEDEQEAEAYWGMILSEYGVEYVEDPNSLKRVPTCHRTQVQSILDNTNYKLALQYSYGEQKLLYQEEAEVLNNLQRIIFSVSSRLDPYDVFICYKETDDRTGERTYDSVLAQNIYEELEKQGIKTFFSRISLEDHLGENYEPYIYSALKSARVMLVVSTESEHCNAVWVRNEWSRFLRFMEEDNSKVLIPVYQKMEVYDFPSSLSKYQAQDMSKVGAIQDLARGIKKILGTTKTEARDAIISALVEDKQLREAKNRKIKKLAVIAAVLLAIVAICFAGSRIFRQKEAKENLEYARRYDDLYGDVKESNSGEHSSVFYGVNKVSVYNINLRRSLSWSSGIKPNDAIAIFEELVQNDPDVTVTREAQGRLALIWLEQSLPLNFVERYTETLKSLSNQTFIYNLQDGISEQQLQLAEVALERYYALTDKGIELGENDIPETIKTVAEYLNKIVITSSNNGMSFKKEAAKLYNLLAPYDKEAKEALDELLIKYPNLLN